MNKTRNTQTPATASWGKEEILLALTQGDLQAIADLLDRKLDEKLDQKLDQKLDEKLDQKFKTELAPIYERLDRLDDNFKYLDVKLNKTNERLENLDISFRLFAQSTKKEMTKMQDSIDTIITILQMNELIPGQTGK